MKKISFFAFTVFSAIGRFDLYLFFLSKKLISQGIDPRTHKPLKPSISSSAAADDHHGKKASSSSRKHPASSPIPNDPFPSSGLEEIVSGGSTQIIGENGFHEESADLINHYGCLNIITGSAAERIGNGEDHENINYCTEDVFSSFLNSLINEDVFTTSQNQHQLPQIHQPNGMINAPTNVSDATFCFGSTSGGGMWADSTLLPSSENPERHKFRKLHSSPRDHAPFPSFFQLIAEPRRRYMLKR